MGGRLRSTVCACTNLRRASRAICHLYDLVLAPTGLKSTQFMVLQVIAESETVAHCDLAEEFSLSMETLSRRLAGAKKSGLVQMRLGEHNRRMYSLTPKGREALDTAWPYWERAQQRMKIALGDQHWNDLASFAERAATAASKAETLSIRNLARQSAPVPGD